MEVERQRYKGPKSRGSGGRSAVREGRSGVRGEVGGQGREGGSRREVGGQGESMGRKRVRGRERDRAAATASWSLSHGQHKLLCM